MSKTIASSTIPLPAPLLMSDSMAADWKRFHSQWQNYEVAADLAELSTQKRAAIFLACVGTDAYQRFQTMDFEDDSDRQDIEKVIAAFTKFCVGEVNITYERYLFNKRTQNLGESFDNFLSELRRLARTCDYGDLVESIITDRIVLGIQSDVTRRKLLQIRKLSLNAAIDVCKSSEIAHRQLQAISAPTEVHALHFAPKRSAQRQKSEQRTAKGRTVASRDGSVGRHCKYCKRQHEMRKEACPAYGQTCRKCGKQNHFATACRSNSAPSSNKVHQLDLDQEELLSLKTKNVKRLHSNLRVDGHSIRFLLDCGSTVNLLSQAAAKLIDPNLVNLKPPTSILRMFDDTVLQTVGILTARIQHPRSKELLEMEFYVTESHKQPILGLEACLQLDLLTVDRENICTVRITAKPLTREDILDKYGDVFDGLGLLEGDVHLDTDPSVQPVQMPMRRIPHALKDKVEAELQQMCTDGIIEKVTEPSDWINPMLVIARPDGRVRIVLDPLNLNKALLRAHYRLPVIDDVLPQLTRAKVFSTVDAKNGFYLLKLDTESSKLTTFESPFARWRYLRMPLGISPAPEIFQARVHDALRGLRGIACIADDILIYGSGDTLEEAQRDHDENLTALLDRCREKGLKLNRDKLQLNRKSTRYMGHELTSSGLAIDKRKTRRHSPDASTYGSQRCYENYRTFHVRCEVCSEF